MTLLILIIKMSAFPNIFSSTFKRSTYEKIPMTEQLVGTFVQNTVIEQIETAKKNKLPTITVNVSFPDTWKYDSGSNAIISNLMEEMVRRFEPIEIPWGGDGWKVITSTDLMEHPMYFVRKFRFTISLC